MVKVQNDLYLETVLQRACDGGTPDALAQHLLARVEDDEISYEDAISYIQELISNNLLVSALSPLATGDPLSDLTATITAVPSLKKAGDALVSATRMLREIDQSPIGLSPAAYERVIETLQLLPPTINPARIFQVDMTKPLESGLLPEAVVEELLSSAEILGRFSRSQEPEQLSRFRDAFVKRYQGAAVPLLEVLDEEFGIGFGEPTADASPALGGIRAGATASPGHQADLPHFKLLQKLNAATSAGATEIVLDPEDLPEPSESTFLPTSFAVNATIAAASAEALSNGDFAIRLRDVVGPPGARFFGRFCHTDPELSNQVRAYLGAEAIQDPEAIFAEIVHLPEGRLGNVLCRPVLREYEIVYLGRSGAPIDRQILASDLLVSVENGHITLRSRKLGRRIVPRLANAHGFTNPLLSSAYRFLCLLQHQHGVSGMAFRWGTLEQLDYLPRLRAGRTVLSTARWRVSAEETKALCEQTGWPRFLRMQQMRQARAWPRWLLLEEADHALPVDLDNPLSVDATVHLMKRTGVCILREMYPDPTQLYVTSQEGRYFHELNVPFIRHTTADPKRNEPRTANAPEMWSPLSRFVPGTEWLYLKLYGGSNNLDALLGNVIKPLIDQLTQLQLIEKWHFLRYADPDFHIRIRFQGEPAGLIRSVFPLIHETLRPHLDSGVLWKLQLDTYERETNRYGGLPAMEISEEIFRADSIAVVDLLATFQNEELLEHRWKAALLGLDYLLDDFGLDQPAKIALLERARPPQHARKRLSGPFRQHRSELAEVFASDHREPNSPYGLVRAAFRKRSTSFRSAAERLYSLRKAGRLGSEINDLLASYMHMHVNRFMRSVPNEYELMNNPLPLARVPRIHQRRWTHAENRSSGCNSADSNRDVAVRCLTPGQASGTERFGSSRPWEEPPTVS